MRIRATANDLSKQKADLAVCFAHEKDTEPRGVEHAGLRRELAAQMKAEKFDGSPGDPLVWNADDRYPSRRFLVVGLGPERDTPGESIRRGAARAARAAAHYHARSLAMRLPAFEDDRAAAEARAAAEGAILGAYEFDRYLTDPRRKSVRLSSVEVGAAGRGVARAVERADVTGRAVCLVRDLVNEGPSRMTPSAMARVAQREARGSGLRCKVLGPAELKKLGMHALLAVARGSAEPPRVVHLVYGPAGKRKTTPRVVMVGKGVTFDSGGLNLKPGDSMLTMKCDMAGAAAVLGVMTALRDIGCKAEVHALLGLTENMTGAWAYKPGDILDTYAGKTVEVGNTDAEGRLVMCDLLAHAAKTLRPTTVIDVATLTGACVVALGTQATGLFTRHGGLRDALLGAALAAGEKLWPLPMYEEYLQELQKGPADLRNVGSRWGGATTAALFLGEFLPRDLPWAHLDIAGPAFADNESPEVPAGGTGAGVLTLTRWLESL